MIVKIVGKIKNDFIFNKWTTVLFLSKNGPPVFQMFHLLIVFVIVNIKLFQIASHVIFLTIFGYKIILFTNIMLNKNFQKNIPKMNHIKVVKFLKAKEKKLNL